MHPINLTFDGRTFQFVTRGRVYCVLSDRKYQVIFCNFSTLPIDLWLAAAIAFHCHAALHDAHFALFAKQKASQVSVVLPQ